MGKTKRYVPKDGQFKRLKGERKRKNKKERSKSKANLQILIQLESKRHKDE
jgi:hypothetical protein